MPRCALGRTAAVAHIQQVLDRRVLATVHINPESRVKVESRGREPELVQGGTRLFLVKVFNEAGVTAPLRSRARTAGRVFMPSRNSRPEPPKELTDAQVRERWADIVGLHRAADAAAAVRPRDRVRDPADLQPRCRPAIRDARVQRRPGNAGHRLPQRRRHPVQRRARRIRSRLSVLDEHGKPVDRRVPDRGRRGRIYPNVSKRLAPDFYFQPQVYRSDGETIDLPSGSFTLTVSRGPEYCPETRRIASAPEPAGVAVPAGPLDRSVAVRAGISGDHHIHAAGCSHYENPTEGVLPEGHVAADRGRSARTSRRC